MLFTSSIFYSKNICNLLLKIESRIRLKKTNKQTNKKQKKKRYNIHVQFDLSHSTIQQTQRKDKKNEQSIYITIHIKRYGDV